MKSLPLLALFTAAATVLVFPVSFELAVSIVVTLSVAAIAAADYSRGSPRLSAQALVKSDQGPQSSILRLAA
jgi:hypothetical protein